jgi:hypothetical protein
MTTQVAAGSNPVIAAGSAGIRTVAGTSVTD